MIEFMTQEIEKRTDGRIKFELYWDSVLVKRKEMLRGTMIGVCDMGSINVAFHPAQLHCWSIFNTFMLGPADPYLANRVKSTCYETIPAFRAELEKWNQKIFAFWDYLPAALGSTSPVTSTADLVGKRIRSSSAWQLKMLGVLGATPVSLPWGECYLAMERGTLDVILTSLDSFERYNFDEVVPYFFVSKEFWIPQPFLFTINLDTWNKLLPQDQQVILEVGQEATKLGLDLNVNYWDECVASMVDRSGVTFTEIPYEELIAWNNLPGVQALPDEWVETAAAAGLPAEEIMAMVKGLIEEALAKEKVLG